MIHPSTIVLLVGFTKSVASIFLGGSVGIALSLGIIRYQAHNNDEMKWTPFAGPRAVEIKVESRLPFLSSFFSFETL
jgi:hypothetical protein